MRKVFLTLAILVAALLSLGFSANAALPVMVSGPTVVGQKAIFEPLTLDTGTWENMSGGTFFHQWQRKVSGNWEGLDAFGTSYIPGNRDVGRYMRVQVIAYNGEGGTEAFTPVYYIRGSGVNGVEAYAGFGNPIRMKSNGRVKLGRVLCNEGYCRIKRVRVKIRVGGAWYRARAIFSKKEIGPNKTSNIAFRVPGYLRSSLPARVRMKIRAASSNGDVRVRVIRRNIYP